ncbi:MAG TPA: flagellar biosynthesis protein FlhB [Candidatus Eremiobacteraeota bacterium]|nr:flagellar biosynthesis protein FlhB [Candidatus Eremiobacteraeota bacterium]
MAESDQTEEPTDHKLQESRKKGQVCKGQDFPTALILVGSAAMLHVMGKTYFWKISEFAYRVYHGLPNMDVNIYNVGLYSKMVILMFLGMIIPLLAVVFMLAIAGNLAQIGFIFATDPISPKLSKINPFAGFKKIFSMKTVFSLVQNILKVGATGTIAYLAVKKAVPVLAEAVNWDVNNTVHYIKQVAVSIFSQIIIVSFVLAGVDYMIQKHQFMKDMRMSFKELKDEYKETEGNPEIKGKQKQIARQMAMGGMMQAVPDSEAVVTNPVELAVAIKYDPATMQAPQVVAKGKRLIALQIKAIAEEHDIFIYENVDLAQTMFQSAKVGQTIPVELYTAVAEVLAYVYKQKKKREMARMRRMRNRGQAGGGTLGAMKRSL